MLKTVLQELIESIRNRFRPIERPDLLVSSPHEHDEHSEIEFTPINVADADQDSDEHEFICPVTRQKIDPVKSYYQCHQCGTAFSPEGWDFLQDMAQGECCACRSQKTIHIALPSRKIL